MSREELELMQQLKRLSQRIPDFVMAFAGHDLSLDAELDFVHQLAGMAEGLLRHANVRRGLTIDGEPLPLVIDALPVQVEYDGCELQELPSRSALGDGDSP